MRTALIVAMDQHGLIGTAHGLPWRLPADLKRFRKLTTGKPIIMGRRTFDHIGGPLKDRLNIVLTRRPTPIPGCLPAASLEDALQKAAAFVHQNDGKEIMVIGGADIYRLSACAVGRIYLTLVIGAFSGTTYFPFDAFTDTRWITVESQHISADDKNPHPHHFLILDTSPVGASLSDVVAKDLPIPDGR